MDIGDHPVELRPLGQTGLRVSPIGLGVMQFAGRKGYFRFVFDDIDQPAMDAIIHAALDGGINWFDTAEVYGGGRSEAGLASALRTAGVSNGSPDRVIIATKWWPILRRASSITWTIDDRLRYLDGFPIDLYYVHQPWSFSSPESEMNAMADLVEAGKIGHIAVSNFSVERMRRAQTALARRGLKLAANQVEFSLLNRSIERSGLLDTCQELGITVVAYSPLARGLLSGKFHRDPERLRKTPLGRRMVFRSQLDKSRPMVNALEEIGACRQATPAQVALNWVIHFHGPAVVAIPGASTVRQAMDNAAAMEFRLSEAELTRLDELSRAY
jgi:aryl-alcohol dehydrogenase-like predicted oxidoreductase